MSSLEEIYSLNCDIKSFAVANAFVENTNKACYQLGKAMKPFCIYAEDKQKAYNVIDFAQFEGILDKSKTLVTEISDYRKDVYKTFGINADLNDPMKRKLLFYDYLMSISICYVEVPKFVTKDSMHLQSYDKFLCTRNPAIMAAWMGATTNEMQVKYSNRIAATQIEFNLNEIRYIKLNHTGKGNSLTAPRKFCSVEQMRCVPLYMLYAFTEGFKTILADKIIEFTYLKDSGQERVLNSTLSESILMDYYNDNLLVHGIMNGVDINSVEQGGMVLSSKVNRGYIKIPELGASRYDTGVRSLNIARILKMQIVDEVDRSFIDADLENVVDNFTKEISAVTLKNPELIPDIYRALVKEEPEGDNPTIISSALMGYVEKNHKLLSTTYDRSIHMFLIEHPEWFPLYTGRRDNSGISLKSVTNVGVVEEDIDF